MVPGLSARQAVQVVFSRQPLPAQPGQLVHGCACRPAGAEGCLGGCSGLDLCTAGHQGGPWAQGQAAAQARPRRPRHRRPDQLAQLPAGLGQGLHIQWAEAWQHMRWRPPSTGCQGSLTTVQRRLPARQHAQLPTTSRSCAMLGLSALIWASCWFWRQSDLLQHTLQTFWGSSS